MIHRRTSARARRNRLIAVVLVAASLAACGKKGPPLAPLVRIPAVVQRVTAAQLGRQVYLTFTLPSANVDRSTPADIGFVDVYVYVGATAPRVGFIDQATRIARIPVVPAPVPAAPPASPPVSTPAPSAPSASTQEASPQEGAVSGSTITIVDTLTDTSPTAGKRFYLAVPLSTRDRPGPQHMPVELSVAGVPPPPTGIVVDYTATSVTVSWDAVGAVAAPAPRVNVYRAPEPGETPPAQPWQQVRPMPVNAMPLTMSPFSEAAVFGTERCYVLRSVMGEAATAVEGEPSPRVCVTPVDRFPPAAPSQLVALATDGAISLLWEANTEPDLGGYLVLRGNVGDARLQPLTPMPIPDVRFSDTTVVSGMRYVYAVVAVDRQSPTPNVSAESMRVEETAQ